MNLTLSRPVTTPPHPRLGRIIYQLVLLDRRPRRRPYRSYRRRTYRSPSYPPNRLALLVHIQQQHGPA